MKRLILAACLGIMTTGVLGQGTIQFNNRLPAAGIDAKFFDPCRQVGMGAGYTAQLYFGPEGTPVAALKPLFFTTTFRTGFAAGYVNPVDVMVPGIPPGAKVVLVMRAYNAATFESSSISITSNPITITLGGGLLPPAPLLGLHGVSIVGGSALLCPEPSSFLLVFLGAVMLLLRFRSSVSRSDGCSSG